ncbi:DUF2187 family protein [Neobacillus cucumis]|uniref:DUF2187 domain-containing protein n=1 Tax=Neobacillus cucumis TaxID=1740721 RepID=A0A2N5H7B5_9BACI|nr:DUF2187 family protein [Neobacillus cucumis]PLS01417.1 DUF2187 domain-containing protein [Neobacillus cucumis]
MLFKAQKKAEIGDRIFFKNGVKGIVQKVYDNSVITKIIENKTELEFKENITVVAHKNYRVLA